MTPDTWTGLVDDAAALDPAPDQAGPGLHETTAAYAARSGAAADLAGSLVLRDTDLPLVRGFGGPLSVVVTGGAGQLAGPAGLCRRLGLRLAALVVALRDPDDLPGNARRVVAALDAARSEGVLGEETAVSVELPELPELPGLPGLPAPPHGWLAAADEVASAELRLALRGSPGAGAAALVASIDAALDRETPFTLVGPGHDVLGSLVATRLLFDGAPAAAVAEALSRGDADALPAPVATDDLAGARRWLTSVHAPSVEAVLAGLQSRGALG